MRILLVGNGHRKNRGCEAITLTTIETIRKKVENVEFIILSFNPLIDEYYERFGVRVFPLQNADRKNSNLLIRILRRLNTPFPELLKKYTYLTPYIDKLKECDLVLSLGGDNYTDDYGVPYLFWELARWAKAFDRPFVIWGASVGPFRTPKSLKMAKRDLRCVSLITARENSTVSYLRSIQCKSKVVRVFDSAFLLQPTVVKIPNFKRKADIVGFNISPLYHKYTGKSLDEVLTICKKFIQDISRKYNVLLLPHVVKDEIIENDAAYMRPLANENENIFLINTEYDSSQLKYIISCCKYFVGARTHATIAAFSSGVPTLSLGYSMKAKGLNEDLFGSDEYLIEAKDFDIANLKQKFAYLEQHGERAKELLLEKKLIFSRMVEAGVDNILLCLQ